MESMDIDKTVKGYNLQPTVQEITITHSLLKIKFGDKDYLQLSVTNLLKALHSTVLKDAHVFKLDT